MSFLFGTKQVTKSPSALRIGILGAAKIAPTALIEPASKMSDVIIAAVAARNENKAAEFAKKHKIPKTHWSYDGLIHDPDIDVIYNPLPNGLHHEWTIKALRAGKHVLCEKPIASNAEQAKEMLDCATAEKKVLFEAFHYRYHPALDRFKTIIDSGEIGQIKEIYVKGYLPSMIFGKDDIRFSFKLGGGMMMDFGCYCTNLVRFLVGQQPEVESATPKLMHEEIDEEITTKYKFPNGVTAVLDIGLKMIPNIGVTVTGDKGSAYMFNWVLPAMYHFIDVFGPDGKKIRTEKVYGSGESTYFYQLQKFVAAVKQNESFSTNGADAIKNMEVIDKVYLKAGLKIRP